MAGRGRPAAAEDLAVARWLPGRDRADVPALVDAVLAFARMAQALGDRLVEAEINPLFVRPLGQGVRAADAIAIIGAGAA